MTTKIETLRELLGTFNGFLDETIEGLSPDEVLADPAGEPASIAASTRTS